jgi:hypothetical protein
MKPMQRPTPVPIAAPIDTASTSVSRRERERERERERDRAGQRTLLEQRLLRRAGLLHDGRHGECACGCCRWERWRGGGKDGAGAHVRRMSLDAGPRASEQRGTCYGRRARDAAAGLSAGTGSQQRFSLAHARPEPRLLLRALHKLMPRCSCCIQTPRRAVLREQTR